MIRHGAELVHAYCAATVPRLCVVLRKAYGGAYIVMDSRGIGNDLCVAWPGAEIAVMGAPGRRADPERPAARALDPESARRGSPLVAEYDDAFGNPYRAAERGLVDAVIDPGDDPPRAVRRARRARDEARRQPRSPPFATPLCRGHEELHAAADKRILVTGVLNDASIAFSVAQRAQEEGAEVVLTSFGRAMSLTQRAARRLADPPDILELDVTDPRRPRRAGGAGRRAARRRAARDRVRAGVVPRRRLPHRAVGRRRGRAAGLGVLAQGARRRVPPADAARRLDRRARLRQQPRRRGRSTTGWASPRPRSSRPRAYLARDLGPDGIRVNLVAAGPLRTIAAKSIPGFEQFEDVWAERAPLGWDVKDPAPVAARVRRAALRPVPGDHRRDRPRRRRLPRRRCVAPSRRGDGGRRARRRSARRSGCGPSPAGG